MSDAEARLNNLLTKPPAFIMNFGKALGTTDSWLRGVGSIIETGFPVPHAGYIYKMVINDEAEVHVETGLVKVEEHDLIAFEADHDDIANFTIKLYVNGEVTELTHVIDESCDCALTVYFGLE